jgi:hypothetical protein
MLLTIAEAMHTERKQKEKGGERENRKKEEVASPLR